MKTTQTTIQQRVEEILAIRLDGAQFFDLRRYVAEKEAAGDPPWTIPEGGQPLSERSLSRYCQRADRLLEESNRESRKRKLNRHIAQRKHLYAKAVSAGDYRTALSTLRDEADLLGLYPPKGIGIHAPSPSSDEARKQFQEMLAKDPEAVEALSHLSRRMAGFTLNAEGRIIFDPALAAKPVAAVAAEGNGQCPPTADSTPSLPEPK